MRLLALVILFLFPSAVLAQGVDDPRFHGTWHGTLDTGGPQLRLELEIGPEASALISLDQGNARIAASAATLDGDALAMAFAPTLITMELALTNPDTLSGTFIQGQGRLPITLVRGPTPYAAPPEANPSLDVNLMDGYWVGTVHFNTAAMPMHMEMGFHIDTETQTARGYTFLGGGELVNSHLSFIGHIAQARIGDSENQEENSTMEFALADAETLLVNWALPESQGADASEHLREFSESIEIQESVFQRASDEQRRLIDGLISRAAYDLAASDRIDHEFEVESGSVALTGTLRLPEGDGPAPAILLLNGSGPQDRDATIAGHRVFGVLADTLAERGIASLRLDDRGVGGSDAVAPDSPYDLAEDAAAALRALRADPGVSGECAAILGHSEGGLIAFLAAEEAHPAYIITLAGMAGTMAETLYEQSEALILAAGGGPAGADANRVLQDAMFAVMRTTPAEEAPAALEAALIERGFPEDGARQQGAIWGQPYALAGLDLDPSEAMAAYDGPVHAFFGERDLQVLPEPNAARIREARGDLPTEVTVIDGVSHLFQDAETGLPDEYASAPHAMAPRALEAIADAAEALIGQACN
ncbi:alpha/beta hydrolase family protein [Hyphobacterium marinum]|uniref:Alpha/beta hydrolase n=1 Tax=Hyphobacterium marinum TaxID=3116574 RepID=A0ABU7LUT3_9PROT|nr:alpha/beta hydrolase [Hyphobacterium sp. Y6023]MEE2565312.1 alpha/beta hydrolase [Hyphobacterium sp. Y6023]